MKEEILRVLQDGSLRCSRCKLIIPFGFERGGDPAFTVPSFTLVDNSPVCYSCYHPEEFGAIVEKRKSKRKKRL